MATPVLPPGATPARQQLLTLLEHGTITKEAYDTILAELSPRGAVSKGTKSGEDSVTLEGNIIIQGPPYTQLKVAANVFNIPELLEMILAFLPPLFLVCRASRVCKGFRNAIETSLILQRTVFRAPDPQGGRRVLLKKTRAPRFKIRESGPHCDLLMGQYDDKLPCLLVSIDKLDAIEHSSTLRKTLVMQPPILSARLAMHGSPDGPTLIPILPIAAGGGLTFGDVLEAWQGVRGQLRVPEPTMFGLFKQEPYIRIDFQARTDA